MAAPRSRAPLAIGLAAAGGVGYYLYTAGGSPKAAEKKFEADISKASANVKSHMPGRTDQYKDQAESYAHEAASKLDSTHATLPGYKVYKHIKNLTKTQAAKAKAELAKAEKSADAYAKDAKAKADAMAADAKKSATQAIDKFDAKVEEKAAQAKSGLSSWFGGK